MNRRTTRLIAVSATVGFACATTLLPRVVAVAAPSPAAMMQKEDNMQPSMTLRVGSPASGVAWSDDGSQLAAYSDFGRNISLWRRDGTALNVLRRDVSYNGNSLSFLPGGTELITPTADDSHGRQSVAMTVWDIAHAKPARDVEGPAPGHPVQENRAIAFALSPKGDEVAAVTSPLPGKPVTVYAVSDWAAHAALPLPANDSALSVAFSPDSRTVAVGTVQGRVVLFDTRDTGREPRVITAFTAPPTIGVDALAFSPDGRFLATGAGLVIGTPNADTPLAPVKVWRVEDGGAVASFSGTYMPVRQVSWAADGRTLAAAGGDRTLRLFTLDQNGAATGSRVVDLGGAVTSARFSPDGRAIAATSGDSVMVFNLSGDNVR
jgi:eukaryotic-like serine/threonine-protein kinase